MSFLLRSENWPVGWPVYVLVAVAFLYALGGKHTIKTNHLRSAAFYSGLATLAPIWVATSVRTPTSFSHPLRFDRLCRSKG